MIKNKGFYGLILAIVVLTLFLPACFKLGGEPSINAEFTLTREEVPFFGISEYAFSVDVKGVKDAAVVEFDNGMPSIALNGDKAESRFFANIGTEEVTLVVRDSRGVELLKKTIALEKTVSQFREAALGPRTGLYLFDDPDLIFYSVPCLAGLTLWEKSELLDAIDDGLGAYIVVDIPGFVRIYDFNEYPYGDMPLTQDTLVTLELPYFAERFCEGGFFEIVTDTALYSLDVDWNEGGEVEVVPDPDYALNLYKDGTVVSLKATADTGYYFGGWTGSVVSPEPEETVVMDEDKIIFGNFVEESEPYMVDWSYEPDPVCEEKEFEVTVEVQNATKVEITFNEGVPVEAEKNGDIYTATFTAPSVPLSTFKPLKIVATNETKTVTLLDESEGIYVLTSEGEIEILKFDYAPFGCDATGTFLYVKTCCYPEPEWFDILVEGPFENKPEFVSKERSEEIECAYLITFWWEFGTVACADAT
uniref:InlB B-repeat-containing protein n=1 Tax=Mesotoga prima TaxID=1184387 RepID=UPI002FDB6000